MQRFSTNALRSSIIKYIIAAVTIFVSIVFIALYSVQQQKYNEVVQKYEKDIHRSVQYTIKNYLKYYKNIVENISENDKTLQYMKEKNRVALHDFFEKKWNELQSEEPYLTVLHFHLADGISLLRMHQYNKFGDDIASKREMLREIHKNHKLIYGYETGVYATPYRIIAPIFDKDGTYLGAVELGLNPNFILNDIFEINGFKGMVFIKDSALKMYSRPNEIVVDGYRLQTTKDEVLQPIYKKLAELQSIDDNKKFFIGSTEYLTHLFELNDFQDRERVKILFLQNLTNIREYSTLLMATLFFSLLLIFYILIRKISEKINLFHDGIKRIYLEQMNELQASKQQFDLFMKNIPYEIVIEDVKRKVVYENSKERKFHNYFLSARELVDELYNELTDTTKAEKIVHVHIDEKKYIARVLLFQIPQSSGEIFIGYIYSDITNEYTVKDEVRKLNSALQKSPIMVLRTNRNGKIEYANEHFCEVSGYTPEELYGNTPSIIKSDETDKAIYKEMWEAISQGCAWMGELKNRAKDGSSWWESTTILPSFNEDKELDGYIAFKIDISEKVTLQQKLHDQEEIMIAQSRNAAMGEMISMIAHQWRQPISVIAMEANNMLLDIDLDMLDGDALKKELYGILAQTEELSNTIDDFRNFFRSDKNIQEIAMEQVVNDALGVIGTSLENNEVELVRDITTQKAIQTYPRELMQVFLNIIKNAKEILVEKNIENKVIKVSVFEQESDMVVKICDNAGGVPEDIIGKIFTPYFSTKDERNGTGLGLYMSKTIVEKHLYGELKVFNEANGACFEIVLPQIDFNEKIEGESK